MGIRTSQEYLAGLNDSRRVYYQGQIVPDVTQHPELGLAARHAALDYRLAERPDLKGIAVWYDEEGHPCSAFYRIPTSATDLLERSRLIELGTAAGGTLVLLIKEIGTDALFALLRVLRRAEESAGLKRLENFYHECRNRDFALGVAQTDVKGNRSKLPTEQIDPDLYLRVVRQTSDGIVVRGAKIHTSCSPYVDYLLVIPSRSMKAGDEQWSMAFAVPVATPGLALYASSFLDQSADPFTRPISSRHRMVETLTVFDDVFVPWERVFFTDRPDLAGATALTFVDFHRFTAVSYKLPLLDALVGCGISVAQANGIDRASHVREKLSWLAGYAETVRALTEVAAARSRLDQEICCPDVFTTNLAKWTFARDFHRAIQIVMDLAGGLLVTGPSGADWRSSQIRAVLEKYLAAAWPAQQRMALINLISDLTSSSYGGYQAVLAIHAEGSIEAEKLAMYRSYDGRRAVNLALRLAGIEEVGEEAEAAGVAESAGTTA